MIRQAVFSPLEFQFNVKDGVKRQRAEDRCSQFGTNI